MNDRSSQNDLLALVLQELRPTRASYGRLLLTAPWGIELPFQDGVRFHLVVEGHCQLEFPGGEPIQLKQDDVALLPHGVSHVIRDAPGSTAAPLATIPAETIGTEVYRLKAGGQGAAALLICCTVGFDAPAARLLLSEMPACIVLRAGSDDPSLRVLLEIMADEARRERMGMATLLSRIADVVVTWSVRAWAEQTRDVGKGWVSALREPGIGLAVLAIHREPGRHWSLRDLARIAGLSRTQFASRFASAVGRAPGRYSLEWRMAIATDLLRSGQAVATVAEALGYGSEASFARAYKRVAGVPPGLERRRGRV